MNKRGIIFIIILSFISFNTVSALDYRNLTEIATVTHWPFYTIYTYPTGSDGVQAGLPKDWPNNNATDSDIIKNFSVSAHNGPFYTNNNQNSLLDWALKTGQGIDISDSRLRDYVQFGSGGTTYMDSVIAEIVTNYANNPSYRGASLADEPYGHISNNNMLDTAPSRARYVFDKFRELDSNISHRYYFPTAGGMTLFRHCRDARPDVALSSGAGYLHHPFAAPLNGSIIQNTFNNRISIFDDAYMCTENYNIPFGYSNAASNWAGVLNPAEAKANTYLILAHGGKYILWFVYSTAYGIVWENNNPSQISYFTYWSPANWGGRQFPIIANINYAIDNSISHSGSNSLRVDSTGAGTIGNNIYIYGDSEYDYLPNITYTLSVWTRSTCATCLNSINFNGGSPWEGFVCPALTGVYDWTKISCNATFSYYGSKKIFAYMNNPGPSTGSVWFDDFSVYDNNNSYETLSSFNPGFELQYGVDRKPMEPGYSTLKELNLIIKNLSEIAPLKKIAASNNSYPIYKGLLRSIDVSLVNNLDNPQVEYGLFTDKDQGGKVYLILVNRVLVDTANLVVKVNSNNSINLINVVNQQSLGTYNPTNGIVTFNIQLAPGDGRVLRLDNLFYYKELDGNIVYNQDFSSGNLDSNEFLYTDGYSIVDDSGNNRLLGDASDGSNKVIFIKNINISDFELTGKFKKLSLTNPANELFFVIFRNKEKNYFTRKYLMVINPSTSQILSYGRVQLVRYGIGSRYLSQTDQNFINDNNLHNFTIRAYGGKIDLYVDGLKYIGAIDNELNESGYIGLATQYGNVVLYDDLQIKELISPYNSSTPITQTLVISNIQITSLNQTSATINWTTDINSNSIIKYGISSGNYIYQSINNSNVAEHSLKLTGLNPVTQYFFVVNSTSNNNQSNQSFEQSFTTLAFPSPSTCIANCTFNIHLNQGLNLISFPLLVSNNSIEYVFSSIKNDVRSVFAYDSLTQSWRVYSPNKSIPSTLIDIEPGQGYFVMMKNPNSFTITGNLTFLNSTLPIKSLNTGWNLIGLHNLSNSTFQNELNGISYSEIWIYNISNQYQRITNPLQIIMPGQGYWVYKN